MIMKKLSILLILLVVASITRGQEKIAPDLIRNTQRTVCAIKIIKGENQLSETISLGCGVVLMASVNDRNEYFIATAYHVLDNLFSMEGTSATVNVFDKNGQMYKVESVKKNHLIWANRSMDAAILALPRRVEPEGDLPENYKFPGLMNLKLIGDPEWGEEIYLFGYRWINENLFIDILKKGILSVGTNLLPGYEGNLVYLIDNMANKGMSGGLAFNGDGMGIGIISSYVYEADNRLQNSDDLTVCLPLTIYFNQLSIILVNDKKRISEIFRY
jgi:Trypsin-like peptidase domain